ncbi:hypothetical protein B0H14DRAFT_2718728 [Mycena olivaceomarginata]|nr:hypothetical protein B0H14DRAFT_2718728 [Mycena olivaceomarginata]
MATIQTTTPSLPDYITYRFANRLVYVRPGQTHGIVLDIAQKEFIELTGISRDRISFNTVATLNRQEQRVVRISESAWLVAVARQLCGGVIDIIVTLDPNSPPIYVAVPGDMMKKDSDRVQPSPSQRSTRSSKRSWLLNLLLSYIPDGHTVLFRSFRQSRVTLA